MTDDERNDLYDRIDHVDAYRQSLRHRSRIFGIIFGKPGCLSSIIITGCIVWFLWSTYAASREKSAPTWSKLTYGQHLYINDPYVKDSTTMQHIKLYTLRRTINADDINRKNIPEWQKKSLIENYTDTAYLPHISGTIIDIAIDTLRKYGTSYIGDFISQDSMVTMKLARRSDNFSKDLYKEYYSIKLNDKFRSLIKQVNEDEQLNDGLDTLFVRANAAIYIEARTVTDKVVTKYGADPAPVSIDPSTYTEDKPKKQDPQKLSTKKKKKKKSRRTV